MMPSGRLMLVLVVAFGSASAVRLETKGQQPQWTPSPPTNLQVLPKEIPLKQLIQTMRGFTMGLGVRCQHCHMFKGSDPNDLSTFDFASDEKEPKKIARAMIQMATAINIDYLKNVGEPRSPGELKVTCYTCHRGETKPATRRTEPQHGA
jgi:hypothetical protein